MLLFKYTHQHLLPLIMRKKNRKIFLIWVSKDKTNDVEQTAKHLADIYVFLFKIIKFSFLVSNFCRFFICLFCILDIKVFSDNSQWFLSYLYVVSNLFIISYAVIKLLNSMGYWFWERLLEYWSLIQKGHAYAQILEYFNCFSLEILASQFLWKIFGWFCIYFYARWKICIEFSYFLTVNSDLLASFVLWISLSIYIYMYIFVFHIVHLWLYDFLEN